MKARLDALRNTLDTAGVEALYVTNLTNIRYLTGFTGSTALLFVDSGDARLFVDPRYHVQAEQQARDVRVARCSNSLEKEALAAVESSGTARLGFEAAHMTVAARDRIAGSLSGLNLVPTSGLIEELRRVKDSAEIAAIRRACALTDDLFVWILDSLKPGIREIDIALNLEFEMRRRGAEAVGFSSIIASGENGAKPHAGASEKPLEVGDLLTMDFGARLDGYNSDITRTVAIQKVDDRQKEIYGIVLEAQRKASAALKPGLSCVDADRVARDCIASYGYGEYFGHGLGHSLGLDVHDGFRLSPMADPQCVITAGEVWTVEPGIYIEGWGGVRIEDDVLVTEAGPEILNAAPKELIVV